MTVSGMIDDATVVGPLAVTAVLERPRRSGVQVGTAAGPGVDDNYPKTPAGRGTRPFRRVVVVVNPHSSGDGPGNALTAVILPTIASGFLVFMFRQFYRGIPRDLREAAMIDGANLWQIIRRIYLPLSRPLMVTAAIVLFIAQWQAFFLPLVVLQTPSNWVAQLALASLQGTVQLPSWGPVLAGGVVMLLVPIILVAPFMRYFKVSILDGSARG